MFKQQNIDIGGSTEPGFESVKKVFKDNFTGGSAQLCVVKNGKIVSLTYIHNTLNGFSLIIYQTINKIVDLWGSVSDPGYDGDSLQTIWSSTKNLTALGMAMLVDRGLLSYGDKVTKHWPEFDRGQKGKGEVFIRGTI